MSVVAVGRAGLAVAALLLVALGVQTCRLANAEARIARETVARQVEALKASGFVRAATDKAPERATPDVAAPKEAPTKIAWRTKTVAVPFSVPPDCRELAGSDQPPSEPEDGGAATTGPPSLGDVAPPLLVSADVQASLAPTDRGDLYLATVIRATLTRGSWSETKELPTDSMDFRVDPEVSRAWAEYRDRPPRLGIVPRPLRHWRTGWFVGPGVSLSPSGHVSGGIVAGLGVQL